YFPSAKLTQEGENTIFDFASNFNYPGLVDLARDAETLGEKIEEVAPKFSDVEKTVAMTPEQYKQFAENLDFNRIGKDREVAYFIDEKNNEIYWEKRIEGEEFDGTVATIKPTTDAAGNITSYEKKYKEDCAVVAEAVNFAVPQQQVPSGSGSRGGSNDDYTPEATIGQKAAVAGFALAAAGVAAGVANHNNAQVNQAIEGRSGPTFVDNIKTALCWTGTIIGLALLADGAVNKGRATEQVFRQASNVFRR
ncbi:MAG: hypothetical protein WCJ33_02290, partial [Pseudomonadota bacterium]